MVIGQIVYSKAGRDKTKPFVILDIQGEYLYLVDGELRKLQNPKKKKIMHVQPTNYIDNDLQNIIINKEYILDSDIRKRLRKYTGGSQLGEK